MKIICLVFRSLLFTFLKVFAFFLVRKCEQMANFRPWAAPCARCGPICQWKRMLCKGSNRRCRYRTSKSIPYLKIFSGFATTRSCSWTLSIGEYRTPWDTVSTVYKIKFYSSQNPLIGPMPVAFMLDTLEEVSFLLFFLSSWIRTVIK